MSKVTSNKPFPVTWPQSKFTLFLTCRAGPRQGRTAFAMNWRLQSSKPVAAIHVQSNPEQVLSRDLAPIRGYFVPYLSSKSESRQNCFRSEVALAELQTSSSNPQPRFGKVAPSGYSERVLTGHIAFEQKRARLHGF